MNKKIVYVISVGSSLLAIVAIRANKTISLKASVVLLTCMSVKQFLGAEYTGTCLASFQIDALKSNNLYFFTCILTTKLSCFSRLPSEKLGHLVAAHLAGHRWNVPTLVRIAAAARVVQYAPNASVNAVAAQAFVAANTVSSI